MDQVESTLRLEASLKGQVESKLRLECDLERQMGPKRRQIAVKCGLRGAKSMRPQDQSFVQLRACLPPYAEPRGPCRPKTRSHQEPPRASPFFALGGSWRFFDRSWRALGMLLGHSWDALGRCWSLLAPESILDSPKLLQEASEQPKRTTSCPLPAKFLHNVPQKTTQSF